jgi:hypothetical protein
MLMTIGPSTLTFLAAAAATLVTMLTMRQKAAVDPVEDLTERLRHPIRWRLQHPLRTIGRRLR